MNYRYLVVDLNNLPKAEDFLTKTELKQYQALTTDKRAKEWLGGRYALKKLATDFFNFPINKMQVANKRTGQPVLLVEGGTNLAVSITHSGDYAGAAISLTGQNIGIDIESIEKRNSAWESLFFRKEELSSHSPIYTTELWAKKEALLKFLGTGLSVASKDIVIINNKIEYYGKCLDIWALKGSPNIQFEVRTLDRGYKFVVAYEAPKY